MRVLVAGGSGFLGSHLVGALLREEEVGEVVVLDDLSSGQARNLEDARSWICNLDKPGDKVLRTIVGRADNQLVYQSLGKFGLVVHAASPASPQDHQRNAWRTIASNVVGAQMLACAVEEGGRLVHLSTSEVYGDPEVSPQPEGYPGRVSCTGPRAPYDEGKRCAEALLRNLPADWGVDVRIARLFNTYGPRMRAGDGRVVSNFITQAQAGEPLTVYGTGTQTRSLCWVGDTTEALRRLCMMPGISGLLVNVGNPQEITMLELAHYVNELVPEHRGIRHLPLPQDDPTRRCPDIALAGGTLGWRPQVGWRDGVRATVDWFRSQREVSQC